MIGAILYDYKSVTNIDEQGLQGGENPKTIN